MIFVKNRLLIGFIVITNGLVISCSSKQVYDVIQHNQKQECFRLPLSMQKDCLDKLGDDFDEYTRKRQEVLDNKKNNVQN